MNDATDESRRARFPAAPQSERRPLEGVRVIEAAQVTAGPFAGTLLADYGADVVKIEHPRHGDPLRSLSAAHEGVPLYWKDLARNKRCVTLDLSTEEGAAVFEALVEGADVLIESFRPGTMERWGLGYETLRETNPGLVVLRVSGFGQTGPNSERPGFGRIAGPYSGLTHLIGEPDGPPMSPSFGIEDRITGVFGALGTMVALFERERGGDGQVIDLALYESVFRLLGDTVIQYDQLGTVAKRTGNTRHEMVVPNAVYETADGEYVTVAASTQSIWVRLCEAMGRRELLDDPRFEDNRSRIERAETVDGIVRDWIGNRTREEVEARFSEHGVAHAFNNTVADVFGDDHVLARQNLVRVADDELGEAVVAGVVPRFSETPGDVRHLGPRKGEHNVEVYRDELGFTEERIERLRETGVI